MPSSDIVCCGWGRAQINLIAWFSLTRRHVVGGNQVHPKPLRPNRPAGHPQCWYTTLLQGWQRAGVMMFIVFFNGPSWTSLMTRHLELEFGSPEAILCLLATKLIFSDTVVGGVCSATLSCRRLLIWKVAMSGLPKSRSKHEKNRLRNQEALGRLDQAQQPKAFLDPATDCHTEQELHTIGALLLLWGII